MIIRVPARAGAASRGREYWSNIKILEFFRVEQQKVVAFASELHVLLGAESCMLSINEMVLIMITDEVLGRRTLLSLWDREHV